VSARQKETVLKKLFGRLGQETLQLGAERCASVNPRIFSRPGGARGDRSAATDQSKARTSTGPLKLMPETVLSGQRSVTSIGNETFSRDLEGLLQNQQVPLKLFTRSRELEITSEPVLVLRSPQKCTAWDFCRGSAAPLTSIAF